MTSPALVSAQRAKSVRDKIITLRLTPEGLEAIEKAAAAEGVDRSTYIRSAVSAKINRRTT